MSVSRASLTVYFDPPFWVGLYQREENGDVRVCRVVFGGEPKDQEVLDYFTRHWRELNFSPPVSGERDLGRVPNPKRARREAAKAVQRAGTGTKAQQALQLQREQRKTERGSRAKAQREAEQERKFTLRQKKRREKHKGH